MVNKRLLWTAVLLLIHIASNSLAQTLGDALNPGLSWTTGGVAVWEFTTNLTHDGSAAAQAQLRGFREESWIQTTITGPAEVSFWSKVPAWNPLYLFIDGYQQAEIAGVQEWQRRAFYVPPGPKDVRWRFITGNAITAGGETVWLDEVSVQEATAPTIAAEPTNHVVPAGNSVTFAAAVTGTEPLTFQWLQNGIPIGTTPTASLTLGNVQNSSIGDYSLVVTNPIGVVTSRVANLTVTPSAPVLTLQPTAQGAPPLANVTFTADAKGTLPITWQWYSNQTELPGYISRSYSIYGVSSNSYADYFVVASNSEGSTTSIVARLNYSPLVVWGESRFGKELVPAAATNIIDICGGDFHCLALKDDGTVLGWGRDTFIGTWNPATVPPEVNSVVSIAAGSAHSLAALQGGTVRKWGHIIGCTSQDVPDEATNVVAWAQGTGAQHALALRADGTVVEWSCRGYLLPVPSYISNIVAVAAGAYHSLALRGDGHVFSWGGDPMWPQVVPPAATNVVAIASGWYHNLALRADGTVVSWGNYAKTPPSVTNVIALACGAEHSLAIKRDGTLYTWKGYVPPSWVTNVARVAGTQYGSMAILADGPPRLCDSLVNRIVHTGSNAFFYARAVGASPLSWQWKREGSNLPGATNVWLSLPNVQASDAGLYSVTVSNAFGVADSSPVELMVLPTSAVRLSVNTTSDGEIQISADGTSGLIWTVETSTNLSLWTPWMTLTNRTGTMTLNGLEDSKSQRFFRLRLGQ